MVIAKLEYGNVSLAILRPIAARLVNIAIFFPVGPRLQMQMAKARVTWDRATC
jgi:hypothetical protein